MKRSYFVSVVILLLAFVSFGCLCAFATDDSLTQAARKTVAHERVVNAILSKCAVGDPKLIRYVKAAQFYWQSENDDPRYAATKILTDQNALDSKQTVSLPPEFSGSSVPVKTCAEYAKNVFDGKQNVKQVDANSFELLSKYLTANPIPEVIWAERETTVGCKKGQLNRGGDIEKAAKFCDCIGKAFVENTTPAERVEYWKTVEDGENNAEDAKWASKLVTMSFHCGSPPV